jgi:hypothetical protein
VILRSDEAMRAFAWTALAALASFSFGSPAAAAPPTAGEIARLCANAEDQAHCGRLIEAKQIPRVKSFVRRDGDELRIDLLSPGSTTFRDSIDIAGARSYALWDYVDDLQSVVLFATRGDRSEFWWVQRQGGGEFRLPAEPVLAPGRRRLATVDFCAEGCTNEVAVWRIEPNDVRKELAFKPSMPWREASVTWKSSDTVVVEYVATEGAPPQTVERRLGDADWTRMR